MVKTAPIDPTDEERVPFNRATFVGTEFEFMRDAQRHGWLSGGGFYGRKCEQRFAEMLGAPRTFLTPSCTASLEMTAILAGISPGDEIIMPSFTFVSTANAFALRGARIVFVDVRPDTMNIDERLVEQAITRKTRALVPVHYAGVACDMDVISELAERHRLLIVEDAAQGAGASFRGRPLGALGHIGAYSFHETKNISSGGEGGLTIVNDAGMVSETEIVREKGTDRSRFLQGFVEKYQWVGVGSSFHTNEISAAYLWAQLEALDDVTTRRRDLHETYRCAFRDLENAGRVALQAVPEACRHNGHLFYLKLRDRSERARFITYLAERKIQAAFHYVPLHSSPAGRKYGRFSGEDVHTTRESERLVRLPLFYNLGRAQQERVISVALDFFASM